MSTRERIDFEKKGITEDVVNMRFKHYQGRLIDLINTVVAQYKVTKQMHEKADKRN